MKTEQDTKKCIRLRGVVVDAYVEADLTGMLPLSIWREPDVRKRADMMEGAVAEFMAFMRDHRSQDMVGLTVIRVKEDVCSCCGRKWESYEENDKEYCAGCGAEVEDKL